ncbi:hypothetical protein [Streptomyces aureus]|uniref:hypothetical protein n=1 Tax=Streptomyces aureus TaxID=193461 RepID=UPI0036B0A1C2
MTDPVSRTILLLDIEKYSDRDDVEQAYLRRMLYDITDRALESAGIDERLRLRADRGDSVMELIDANASVTALLRALLTEVPGLLRSVNRTASSSAQIRLRGVVATGYVAVDELDGWVGSDLNHACRLLDARLLRAALRERPDDFALCVSEGVHTGIVRHGHPGIPADDFHPVTVDSKNGPLRAWLHGPVPHGADDHGEGGGAPAPDCSGESPAPGAASPTPRTASPGTAERTGLSGVTGTAESTGPSGAAGTTGTTQPTGAAPAPPTGTAGAAAPAQPAQPTGTAGAAAPAQPAGAAGAAGAAQSVGTAGAAGPAGAAAGGSGPHEPARSGRPEQAEEPPRHAPAEQPEQEAAPRTRPAAPAAGVVFDFGGGSPSFGGSLVGGDQHGVSGGQVTGDVHLGGSGGGAK